MKIERGEAEGFEPFTIQIKVETKDEFIGFGESIAEIRMEQALSNFEEEVFSKIISILQVEAEKRGLPNF